MIFKKKPKVKVTLVQFPRRKYRPPLAALYLAQALEDAGVGFELKKNVIFDVGCEPSALFEKIFSCLENSKNILAVSCWSDELPVILVALEKIKKLYPSKIIILGGIGVSDIAKQILKEFRFVDFVIKGCGIRSFPKLLQKIFKRRSSFGDIRGLVYRRGSSIIDNSCVVDDKTITFSMPSYADRRNVQQYRIFDIMTSWGCPYRCAFCQLSCSNQREVVYKDMRRVIREIKVIGKIKEGQDYSLNFFDEAFILNRRRVVSFCHLLKKENIKTSWTCYGRVNHVDEELLKLLAESRCSEIFFGVESGSNRILREIQKGFTIEKAIEVLLLAKKYIKSVVASFVFLYPFETLHDFRKTLFAMSFLRSHGIMIHVQPLAAMKSSSLYLKYKKNLRVFKGLPTTTHLVIERLPKECVRIIKKYPHIFYFYYYYNSKTLSPILNLWKKTVWYRNALRSSLIEGKGES